MTPDAVPVLEVGGSHVAAAAVDVAAGELVAGTRHRDRLDPDADAATLLDTIAATANRVLDTAPHRADGAWGVALPGPFEYDTGIARYHDVGKFASLAGVPVGAELARRLRRTPTALRFLNDASAFALGAWQQGAAGDSPRLVAITLGTGVGSAFLDRGRVVEDDPRVPPEGRADLLTIDGAPLEDTVSTRAMTGRYAAATGHNVDGLRALAALADDGDPVAREVVHTAMRRLGSALAPWLVSFAADRVVFGGSVTAVWPLIGPPLVAGFVDRDPRWADALRIAVQPDGESTALVGAAVHAARAHR